MTAIVEATTKIMAPEEVGPYIQDQVKNHMPPGLRLVNVIVVEWTEDETPKMPDDWYIKYPNAIWNPETIIHQRVSVTMLYEGG